MLFNSNFFVYIFIPILILLYYGSGVFGKQTIKNFILLFFSLLFYWFTAGNFIFLLLIVITLNWIISILINGSKGKKARKLWCAVGIALDLGFLVYFKYLGFISENILFLYNKFTGSNLEWVSGIILPVGISFFIFQTLSYIIDVYRKKVKVQKNWFSLALYISLFPQLVAGPIVRYETIEKEIDKRKLDFDDFWEGMCRFCIGLGKKVLVADLFGVSVNKIFMLPSNELTVALSWSGLFLYTLQIYYDFSAYSDMAIGLGRVFGFHFNENFLLPYCSKNVTEFWRRWHISLSSFLRDYLYIPLGGNRKGTYRTYLNLFIVFALCGLWHGAAWTFVLWGMYHGLFLIIEKVVKNKFGFEMKGIVGNIITFIIVMFGWLLFRAETLGVAVNYLKAMFGLNELASVRYYLYSYYIYPKVLIFAVVFGILAITPFNSIRVKYKNSVVYGCFSLTALLLAMMFMSDASFTPFIYFQF